MPALVLTGTDKPDVLLLTCSRCGAGYEVSAKQAATVAVATEGRQLCPDMTL